MIFGIGKTKSQVRSEEYEMLVKKIISLGDTVADLQREVKNLSSDCNNLRGRFNRQLSLIDKEEEKVRPKEEEKEETKPLNRQGTKVFMGMPNEYIPK